MPSASNPGSFVVIVLGGGGGPLENDVSGYIVKPLQGYYEHGWVALEGGSGLGSLVAMLRELELTQTPSTAIFPQVIFPPECNTLILKAGYLFSFLSCYLITHAHFDHIVSMILHTGSLPARHPTHAQTPLLPSSPSPHAPPSLFLPSISTDLPPSLPLSGMDRRRSAQSESSAHLASRTPIYASRTSLEAICKVYEGDVWPELGEWCDEAPPAVWGTPVIDGGGGEVGRARKGKGKGKGGKEEGEGMGMNTRKRRRVQEEEGGKQMLEEVEEVKVGEGVGNGPRAPTALKPGVGVQYCPLPPSPIYQSLPFAPSAEHIISVLHFPVAHGKTTRGVYESSAFFLRLDYKDEEGLEFLFWGDVESSIGLPGKGEGKGRGKGRMGTVKEDAHGHGHGGGSGQGEEEEDVGDWNRRVWEVAARRWDRSKLGAVFIECSYTSERPQELMFGHLNPPTLYAELQVFASLVTPPAGGNSAKPLQGLKIYVNHIKESLYPHPSGKTVRERVMEELVALEEKGGLGVEFVMVRRGMRIEI